MRNGQNNKRMRNRNNNNNNNNRRGQNPMTRVFESNGPDIKIRGTASHVAEKYVQLARDARSSGDPVAAENYYQHAEHYFRLIAAAQEQMRQNQPQPRIDNDMSPDDGDDEADYSNFGQEPGFVPVQQQPFVPRDNHPREGQPYPREQQQPREHNHNREHRQQQQPQYQSQPPQPQPAIADNGGVDRLPSFITGGPQPQVNGGYEGNGGSERGERFPPRRRRRPHGPRPESVAAPAQSEDFNPGGE
ncbi:MAG TPA: DUF4167 domain-containing protein [Bradyrhizobium sp.]|nr:DUF4167 domain-containing protein [Bradyrhizobium sp.]